MAVQSIDAPVSEEAVRRKEIILGVVFAAMITGAVIFQLVEFQQAQSQFRPVEMVGNVPLSR